MDFFSAKDSHRLKAVIQKEGEKPLVMKGLDPKHFTIGSSLHCSLTLDDSFFFKRHKLIRYRRDKAYLVIPADISFELYRQSGEKKSGDDKGIKVPSAMLASVGVLEKEGDFYIVPFEAPTQILLRIGRTRIALEFFADHFTAKTIDDLPSALRRSAREQSDVIFSTILALTFLVSFLSMWALAHFPFPTRFVSTEELDKRYVKLLEDIPIQTANLFKELPKENPLEKAEPEKKPKEKSREKQPTKSPAKAAGSPDPVAKKGLFAALENEGNFKGILENRSLKQAFQGVGVMTTKRPAGQNISGPMIGSRESVNVDDMVAGISARQQQRSGGEGGLGKKTTQVSNPFEISGSGKGHYLRSYGEIDRIIRQHLEGIRILYERYLRQNPAMRGRVSIKFSIDYLGKVTQISVVDSTLKGPEFLQDLLARIKLWRFPAIEQQYGTVAVEYPFTFLPKGSS